jgi:anthranilate phosphoribosyltransferase
MIKESISKVVERIDLTEQEMEGVMSLMMEGVATPSQIAALLVGLRMKGETIAEITGAARVMREKCRRIVPRDPKAVDLCGTGGDRQGTFNVSTTASFIAAGAGVTVAKHGNRSVSSSVGSADVLEELGVNITLSPEESERCLNEIGIAFLYAPFYHPAMKNVSEPRAEIGIRTIFNILGPMASPAAVTHQVIGVYSEVMLEPIAKALRNLGATRCMVVHGLDGMDEITVTGKTLVAELKEGIVKSYHLDPLEFDMKRRKPDELKGGTVRENAQIVLSILRGEEREAKRDISLLNAAAAILVSDGARDLKEAIEIATEAVDSKKALNKLNELIKFTRSRS